MYITGSKEVHKVGLLHIPKTGGTSIVSSPMIQEFGHAMVYDQEDTGYNYLYMYQNPKHAKKVVLPITHLDTWYTLCAVRNIFDWLISYADWCCCFNNWNPDHYDAPFAKKGFDYFIRTIMNRDDRWPCRKFIYCQMFTPTGTFVPDHILHTEQLDDELRAFFAINKQVWVPQPRKQIGRAKLVHKRPAAPELYRDTQLVDEINECWGREMQLLGYDSNPFNLIHNQEQAIVTGRIPDKTIVRYVWDTDIFSIECEDGYKNSP